MGDISFPQVFIVLIVIEYAFNACRGNHHQTPRDSAVSLMLAIPYFTTLTILPVTWVVVYRAVEGVVPWQLPHAWWVWPLGIVVMDFFTYWLHRYHHAINLTWGVHSVHHSSDEYTMTTGGRSTFAEPIVDILSGAFLILVAPALTGLPIEAAAVGWLVKDTWGFAVHTRNVGTLGALEWVLATPSHHRVHHALEPIYANRNYGFVLIIWDKLFGTFQPELAEVPPTFGTTRPPRSFQPIAVALHELRLLWRDARATPRWFDALRLWFMPAGWRPPGVVRGEAVFTRYEPPAPRALHVVGGLQLAYLLVTLAHLGFTVHHHGPLLDMIYLSFILYGTFVTGEYFERTSWFPFAEGVRALIVAGLLLAGTWFGRPLDVWTAALVVLGATNLVAAVALGRAPSTSSRTSTSAASNVSR